MGVSPLIAYRFTGLHHFQFIVLRLYQSNDVTR